MSKTTQHNISASKSPEEQMLIQVLYDMLLKKYPALPGEKSAHYMERLLDMRSGEPTNSLLFVETELRMLFILLRVIRKEIKKANESGSDTTELLSGYFHNKERLEDFIDQWINLNS